MTRQSEDPHDMIEMIKNAVVESLFYIQAMCTYMSPFQHKINILALMFNK